MATGRVPTTANSPLTTKGDLFGYSTAPARLAVGSDGETIVADSSTATGLRYTAGTVQSNPVLNSAMQIWQRGTSVAISASAGGYTADRWSLVTSTNSAMTVSRQATGDTTNLPNIQYCARVQRNSGQTGGGGNFSNSFETINSIPFAGKTVTFSFYARAGANFSATSSILSASFNMGTGTDQNIGFSYTGNSQVVGINATLTTTWQRFSGTGTVPTTANEIALFFSPTFTGTAGANDYYEVTGVQIDIGSVALPFRTNSGTIQGELAAAQRYYYRFTPDSAARVLAIGTAISATQALYCIPYPVSLRTRPTALEQSGTAANYRTMRASGAQDDLTAVPAFDAATSSATGFFLTTSTGLTAGNSTYLFSNSTNAYLGWSAEL